MPYIDINDKERILAGGPPGNPGELNFVITNQIDRYLKMRTLSYQTINDIIGALEGAKLEFYRRIARPYEDSKLALNGDVYSPFTNTEDRVVRDQRRPD